MEDRRAPGIGCAVGETADIAAAHALLLPSSTAVSFGKSTRQVSEPLKLPINADTALLVRVIPHYLIICLYYT